MNKAVEYDAFGPLENLIVREVAEPQTGANEVIVRVEAAGLNPFDFKVRSGLVPMVPAEFPRGIGNDFAGVVTSTGTGATYFDGSAVAIGDEVLGWSETGSIRQLTLEPERALCRKPANLSWEQAGSLAIAGLTAQASFDVMRPTSADTIVVSAAAGAVGLVFCQLAIAAGAKVIGTASAKNHAFLESLGVVPVEYGDGLVERIQQAGTPTWLFDCQGRDSIDAGLALGLAPDHICSIVDHAAVAELGLATPGRYERKASVLAELAAKIASGEIVFPIAQTYPLAEVHEAFRQLETRHVSGKIVVLPQQ